MQTSIWSAAESRAGIDDSRAKLFGGSAVRCEFGMPRAIAMTPLAIDPVGHRAAARVAIMAEQAAIVGPPREIGRRALVEPGAQIPAIFLRVPGERQLDQFPGAGEVEVSSRVIPRPDHVSGIHLESVDLRAGRAELVAALDEPVSAPQHLVVAAGARMME